MLLNGCSSINHRMLLQLRCVLRYVWQCCCTSDWMVLVHSTGSWTQQVSDAMQLALVLKGLLVGSNVHHVNKTAIKSALNYWDCSDHPPPPVHIRWHQKDISHRPESLCPCTLLAKWHVYLFIHHNTNITTNNNNKWHTWSYQWFQQHHLFHPKNKENQTQNRHQQLLDRPLYSEHLCLREFVI